MGWSIFTAKPQLDAIFTKLKVTYKIKHPESPLHTIIVQYEGVLSLQTMAKIEGLFPDFVYVEFQSVKFPLEEEGNESKDS